MVAADSPLVLALIHILNVLVDSHCALPLHKALSNIPQGILSGISPFSNSPIETSTCNRIPTSVCPLTLYWSSEYFRCSESADGFRFVPCTI